MKKIIIPFLLSLFLFSVSFAEKTKKVNETIEVKKGAEIFFEGTSGMNVTVRSWDKNEVYINLSVRISSSDKDYEKEYIEEFEIKSYVTDSRVRISLEESDDDAGWSFWDIFRFRFDFSVSKEVEGEIFFPKDNPLDANIRYSEIDLEGMNETLNLDGRNNTIKLANCADVRKIDNDYGKLFMENCGGNLDLRSRSSGVNIANYDGNGKVDAPYSDLTIRGVSGNLTVNDRSGKIVLGKLGGNLDLDAHYSNVKIDSVAGYVVVKDRSGKLDINSAGSFIIEAPYTEINIKNAGEEGNGNTISNRSGKLLLENIHGDLKIDSDYTDMDINGITGNLYIEGRSAKITGNHIGGNWNSKTEYCTINLQDVDAGEVYVDNRSNPVEIEFITMPTEIKIENRYGDINLLLPDEYKGDVKLYSEYGTIDTDLPLRIKSDGNKISGEREGAGSGKLFAKNRSGNIRIKTLNGVE